jgi:hypothetical protein
VFYEKKLGSALRFGDVLKGFFISIPKIKEPILTRNFHEIKVDVNYPEFCVVMSPCCSIKDNEILIAPLQKVNENFFKNPYFKDDLTNINRLVPPEYTIPPEGWDRLSEKDKSIRISKGPAYTFGDFFIYSENPFFPKFEVSMRNEKLNIGFLMVNFKDIQKACCDGITEVSETPNPAKILELSIRARNDLREKLSWYFSRIPEEDSINLEN